MAKISLKREMIMGIWATLESLKDKKLGIRATYAIVKNKKSLINEVEAIQEASRPSEEFIQYERTRLELCNNLCQKNNDGTPTLMGDRFIFSEDNQLKFNTQLKELQEKYKSALEETQELDTQVSALLKEEVEVEIFEITMDQFSDGDLTVGQMEVLVDASIITDE